MYNTLQKLVAEFFGVFALCVLGIGAICADQLQRAGNPSAAGVGLAGFAMAYGLAVAVMTCATGHISGAHFNPAVTLGCWVTRRIGTLDALLYWIAQLAGGVSGAFVIKSTMPDDIWRAASLGVPALGTGITTVSGMAIEVVCTFFLVWVVFGSAIDEKSAFKPAAGLAIGLTVVAGVLFAGPVTGAALNPARAFGPALVGKYWANHGVYWVGPLLGGAIAGALYDALNLKRPA